MFYGIFFAKIISFSFIRVDESIIPEYLLFIFFKSIVGRETLQLFATFRSSESFFGVAISGRKEPDLLDSVICKL